MRENGTNKNTFWFISDHTARVYLAAWGKQKTYNGQFEENANKRYFP